MTTEDSILILNDQGSKRPKYLIPISASWMMAMSVGLALGYTATALTSLDQPYSRLKLTDSDKSWMASLLPLGGLVGGQIAGFLIDRVGRKMTLMLIIPNYVISWVMIAFSNSIWLLHFARCLMGISCAMTTLVAPIYIGDTSPLKYRGLFSSGFQLSVTIGICLSYIIGASVVWSWLAVISAIFPLIALFIVQFSVESPIWLSRNGRHAEAAHAHDFLFGEKLETLSGHQSTQVSTMELEENKSSLIYFTENRIWVPFALSMMVMFFQQFSGINAILFYAGQIFQDTGSNIDGLVSTIIIGVVQCVATAIACFLTDRLGRRILLMLSGSVMAIGLLGCTLYYYLIPSLGMDYVRTYYGWLPLVSLGLYVAFFSMGFGPLPWVLMNELQPIEIKGIGSGIATSFNWFCCFLITNQFSNYSSLVGNKNVYLTFALLCISSIIFTYFKLPETKGKTMDEIADIFEKNDDSRSNRSTY